MDQTAIKRAEITSIMGDVEAGVAHFRRLGVDVSDPGDREAYDIVARIERKLLATMPSQAAE